MTPNIDIAFDCLPLRSVGRLDVPLDASPAHRARCERIAAAIEKHGAERTYYLENAHCVFRLANSDLQGMVRFEFTGIVRTDAGDAKTADVDLDVHLAAETCGGVPDTVEAWFARVIRDAVTVEFDRYIASGNRDADVTRLENTDHPISADLFAGGDV